MSGPGRFLRIVVLPLLIYLSLILCLIYTTRASANSLFEEFIQFQIQRGVRIPLGENITSSACHRKNQNDPLKSRTHIVYPSSRSKNIHIASLLKCPLTPNSHTNHIRLPNTHYYNISMTPLDETPSPNTHFFNPTLIPLPFWSSSAKYLLVSRVVTSGLHQESLVCLANFCITEQNSAVNSTVRHAHPADTAFCTAGQLQTNLGPNGGLYCTHRPLKINIPPTPAAQCTGAWTAFPDIPGFHDPRVFWSGKGEPLIIVNSASAYRCVGLWLVDLRTLVPQLIDAMRHGTGDGTRDSKQDGAQEGPTMSYPHLTELTRNPRSSRNEVEKNWMLWFPNHREAVLGYDIVAHNSHHIHSEEAQPHFLFQFSNETTTRPQQQPNNLTSHFFVRGAPDHSDIRSNSTNGGISRDGSRSGSEKGGGGGRTISLLIGAGLTTQNLTSPSEPPCFYASDSFDNLNNTGHWHQGSNSLRLILCTRAQARSGICSSGRQKGRSDGDDDNSGVGTGSKDDDDNDDDGGQSVHFAILHRKFSNAMDLPLRYERFFVVWESRRPWRVVGVSRFPVLLGSERAGGWSEEENWDGEEYQEARTGKNRETRRSASSSSYFTYTPSLAWAWRPKSAQVDFHFSNDHDNGGHAHATDSRWGALKDEEDEDIDHLSSLGTGYLGDEVLLGIGLDDMGQAVARVKVEDLLQCLRLCPSVSTS